MVWYKFIFYHESIDLEGDFENSFSDPDPNELKEPKISNVTEVAI